jgi:hypothetical protein
MKYMKRYYKSYWLVFFMLLSVTVAVVSCRKDEKFITSPDAQLAFSEDTILFDTVFTSVGSATVKFMVYNKHNEAIKISKITLNGGEASPYKINIDGENKTTIYNKEISAKDSMYIFVKVRIDPTNANNPFLVEDQLIFETNGNRQEIKLVAYGQDAHYITPTVFGVLPYRPVSGTWINDKPYLIYGFAAVVDSSDFTIEAGCRLYFHKNSGIWIDPHSTLIIRGTPEQKVTLQGDRLEAYYKDLPGQWNGIMLDEGSVDNIIEHAIIRNAVLGIQCEMPGASLNSYPALQIFDTKFENMSVGGLAGNGTSIYGANLLFDQCIEYAMALGGGLFDFQHVTIGNYKSSKDKPSLAISNAFVKFVDEKEITTIVDPTEISFGNSIIWGAADNELAVGGVGTGSFSWKFDHCLLRTTKNISDGNNFSNCIAKKDPLFIDYERFNYKLDTLSPALHQGIYREVSTDIDGNPRNFEKPDLGAYEMPY